MGKISNSKTTWLDRFIANHTKETIHTGEVYLAAGGYYQKSYIAIFEDLTSTFSDDYVQLNESELNVDFLADLFIKELLVKFPDKKFPFNKIVSVTLPSQIIAKAIQEKLERRNDLNFFHFNSDGSSFYSNEIPTLIRLASYYSFTDEVQFQNIVSGDKVLIVNDVISTGGLIDQIYKSVSGLKGQHKIKATISVVLSVVDSRVRLNEHENAIYRPSKFFTYNDFKEESFICLREVKIYKYIENPEPGKKLIRINPILNSRITLESKHSEEDKIAYKDADKFLNQIPLRALKIGHFAQNSLHHSYFLTPNELFRNDDTEGNFGVNLISNVVEKIEKIERNNTVSYYTNSIINQLNYLNEVCENISHPEYSKFSVFKGELETYLRNIETSSINILNKNYRFKRLIKQDDFVFYPVFSGIENLHKIDIQEIFQVDYSNIIPLQRFDTNKGWRFIIPQKSYNSRLKGNSALVIDMGSFTGDSIIQMVDALCVFELRKIIVLSLVGRLEDFDREFFSRIQEMKVKTLKESSDEEHPNVDRLSPVKIYFGVNLHIPPAISSKICEHCNEISVLNRQKEIEIFSKVQATDYIKLRLETLEIIHASNIDAQCIDYLPTFWDGTYDVVNFFSIRNHLGKIDGYRFYTDYYKFFDDLKFQDPDYNNKLEGIIAVCLHENHLLHTISNQLPDVRKKIKNYISDVVDGQVKLSNLFYKWSLLSVLQFYFLINEDDEALLFGVESLTKIFKFVTDNANDDHVYFKFLAYKFAENYHNNREFRNYNAKIFGQTPLINSIKKIWQGIESNKHLRYHSLITHFNRLIVNEDLVRGKEAVKGFNALFKMYDIASAYHPNHSDFANAMNSLKTAINESKNKKSDLLGFRKELDEAEKHFTAIKDNLRQVDNYLNSLIKLFKHSNFASEYINGEKSLDKYLSQIKKLLSEKSKIGVRFDKIWEVILRLEQDYFSLSNNENFYSIWKSSNYLTVLDVLNCFQGSGDNQNNDTFKRFFKSKNYHIRIKEELKSFSVLTTKAYKNVGVNIHPYLLINVFKELLDNSFSHGKNSEVKISLTTDTNTESGITYTVIRYKQNSPAKGEPANGLVDVEKIISDFNGTFQFIPRQKSILIKILIPITHYQI